VTNHASSENCGDCTPVISFNRANECHLMQENKDLLDSLRRPTQSIPTHQISRSESRSASTIQPVSKKLNNIHQP